MTDWIGRTLGKVSIESLLARGGMAEVYKGTHTTLQRKVAVKILRNYYSEDLGPLERFEREARAIARLRHPNIVQVFDFDTIEDQPYLVMEYIPGPSLARYLSALHKRNGRLGLPLISRLLTRTADALQYAHENGVIHRDVKPGNILLSSRSIQIVPGETLPLDLEPVLTDFGLVRFLNASRQTASGLITGTPAYMSPEQAMGQATDGPTDIYSLGVVLYEMLSGSIPFDAETTMSILLKHINEQPPPIPGLSPPLQRVLDRALAKNPADRFQEPNQFAASFNAALEQISNAHTLVTIPQVLTAPKGVVKSRPPRRTRWTPAFVAGIGILLLSAFLLINRTLSIANSPAPTTLPLSDTLLPVIPVTLGPTGILHLQDGNATLDRAVLIAQGMPLPPAGHHYRVWLTREANGAGGEERLELGTLQVDENGQGELTFDERRGRNLLATYHRVEITIEPDTTAETDSGMELAYAYTLPDAGLVYLRGLMASFPRTPDQVGLVHGLTANTQLAHRAVTDMLKAREDGDDPGARTNAESVLNLLVGNQSEMYRDWNGDGKRSDPGDGYGLLLNGDNLGYIQAVYSHADYAINSPGATRNMIVSGEHVQVCTQNVARWAPQLRDLMRTLLDAGALTGMDSTVQNSAEVANLMLNGIDLDGDGSIEPIAGECGARGIRAYAYDMADMPLLPVAFNLLETPIAVSVTVTPTQTGTPSQFLPASPTSTRRPGENVSPTVGNPGQNNQPTNVAPDNEPPVEPPPPNNDPKPTREPKPTKEPKDTKEPGPNQPPGDPPGQAGNADANKNKP